MLGWIFSILVLIVCVLEGMSRRSSGFSSKEYVGLRNNYLLVHLLFKLGDWCQGPYFYSVYASKGFSGGDIAKLFLTGFVSSAVLGTFIGSLADRMGRVRGCQVCGVLFAIACFTTHSGDFWTLVFGRLCGGIATSLLFSSFESWMVCQHGLLKLPEATRDHLFGLDMLGDGIVAMLAGFVAEYARGVGGLSGPFDVSAIVMLVGVGLATFLWKENYGDAKIAGFSNFSVATKVLQQQPAVLRVGLASSLFEGAMFSFVFLWTSTMQEQAAREGKPELALGMVFSCFMAATMVGSRVFSLLIAKFKVAQLATGVMLLGSLCMFAAVFQPSLAVLLFAFLAFEFSVGIYFPAMGTLRASVVPEDVRATLMNLFRVPLNLFVVGLILYSDSLGKTISFAIAAAALAFSFVLLATLPAPSAQRTPARQGSGRKGK